jgi:kinetochore protein Spc25
MATAFEPSLSSSLHRQSVIATGPSIADSLPNINFGFDNLRERMARFTTKYDAFIEQGRKNVLEERNQFRMNVAELQGRFEQVYETSRPSARDASQGSQSR